MSCLRGNAFAVTTRFRKGLNFDFIENMKKYFPKCLMVYCVREMEDDKAHLHSQIWYDKDRTIDDVRKTFKRIIMRTVPQDEYEFPACLRIDVCYNDNFYKSYCQKDIKEIVYSSVDDKKILSFIYSHSKNEGKDKRSLFERLKEVCEGKTKYDDIANCCISYCVESGDCPRRDTLKNNIWWIWMGSNPENHRGMKCLDDLKETLKTPTKLKFKY